MCRAGACFALKRIVGLARMRRGLGGRARDWSVARPLLLHPLLLPAQDLVPAHNTRAARSCSCCCWITPSCSTRPCATGPGACRQQHAHCPLLPLLLLAHPLLLHPPLCLRRTWCGWSRPSPQWACKCPLLGCPPARTASPVPCWVGRLAASVKGGRRLQQGNLQHQRQQQQQQQGQRQVLLPQAPHSSSSSS